MIFSRFLTFNGKFVQVKQNADGMVLGPLPNQDFSFNLKYLIIEGIQTFATASWDPDKNEMSFVNLNAVRTIVIYELA